LADSYIGTGADGVVSDKATVISRIKEKANKFDTFSIESMQVQPYGDAAVATGISVLKGTRKRKDISGRYEWTDTRVKIGGRWQAVAEHGSIIAAR
jgi:hypothetical protein